MSKENQTDVTPSYAWPCLVVSLLAAISLVFEWMWLPGVTFPVFKTWLSANNSLFADPSNFALLKNVMGLVPIGALIMALPASIIVRKVGAKITTLIGMAISLVGALVSAFAVGPNFYIFLVGRFISGLGLSTTAVAGPTCVSIWFPDSTRGRAMAIWSVWAPVAIFISNLVNDSVYKLVGENIETLQLVWAAAILLFGIIFAIVFRSPREDERSQVSPERKPLKEVLQYFKSRPLWCLIIMFAIFNFMNYAFSQYLKTWMQIPVANGGLGWEAGPAGLVGGAICACGVLAPIGGIILDKTPKSKKFLCIVVGICALTICCAFSFKATMFIPYAIFFCIGNMMLNGCCRPMVPSFVYKGGQTAVAFGLAIFTLCQYAGQIATSYVTASFSNNLSEAAAGTATVDPMLAFWALVPIGIIGCLLSVGSKQSKPKEIEAKPEEK